MRDTLLRSIIKSITWRLLGILVGIMVVWVLTHDWEEVTWFTILYHTIRIITYFVHERVWEHVEWGRK